MPYLTMSDGVKLYYEESGRGETIVISHGMNSSHLIINEFIDQFRGDYRLVCYDHRGHGASDRANEHMNLQRLGRDLHCRTGARPSYRYRSFDGRLDYFQLCRSIRMRSPEANCRRRYDALRTQCRLERRHRSRTLDGRRFHARSGARVRLAQ